MGNAARVPGLPCRRHSTQTTEQGVVVQQTSRRPGSLPSLVTLTLQATLPTLDKTGCFSRTPIKLQQCGYRKGICHTGKGFGPVVSKAIASAKTETPVPAGLSRSCMLQLIR